MVGAAICTAVARFQAYRRSAPDRDSGRRRVSYNFLRRGEYPGVVSAPGYIGEHGRDRML